MTTISPPTVTKNDGPVLIVDDDKDLRHFMGDILDQQGIRCVLAGSVEEAIEALDNNRIALTLLDWGLRGGLDTSGAEVLSYCKERYPLLPVVVMSGMPIDVRTECSTKQADGFLSKPFNAAVIVGHVNQWLKRVKQTTWEALPQREEDIVPLKHLQSHYIRHVLNLLKNDLSLAADKLGVSQQTIKAAINDDTAEQVENDRE